MAQKDLISISSRSIEEQQAIRSKGGKTVTDKQRMAAKLREIKKRVAKGQIRTDDEEWLYERVTNPQSFALDLVSFFDDLRKTLPPDKCPAILASGERLMRSIHGDKHFIESRNINVNMDIPFTPDELDDLLDAMN